MINTRVCGYTLDLTRLVCPALQSRLLITRKFNLGSLQHVHHNSKFTVLLTVMIKKFKK